MNALAIAMGGALGSVLRYGLVVAGPLVGVSQAWMVCVINIAGSFAMGYISYFMQQKFSDNEAAQLFIMTGLLGGFTTFSAFSLDFFKFLNRGELGEGLTYVALSVGLAIAGCLLGVYLARHHLA